MSLSFFNSLSLILDITLNEQAEPIAEGLVNQVAPSSAMIQSLELTPSVIEDKDLRDLTPEELDLVVFEEAEVRLCGYGDEVLHRAPDGVSFTVRDLVAAIASTERETRHQRCWYEGIDVHHVFFQGLRQQENGCWKIHWGS